MQRSYAVPDPFVEAAEGPGRIGELDEWIRRRLRMLHLKHWKRGRVVYRELRARGLSEHDAALAAGGGSRWWVRSATRLMHLAFPIRYFDQLGIPRLVA